MGQGVMRLGQGPGVGFCLPAGLGARSLLIDAILRMSRPRLRGPGSGERQSWSERDTEPGLFPPRTDPAISGAQVCSLLFLVCGCSARGDPSSYRGAGTQ